VSQSPFPDQWPGSRPRSPRKWLRRTITLFLISAGLALVGDHTVAGARSQAAVQVPSLLPAMEQSLGWFTSVAVDVRQSIGSMSPWSFEVVSLVVLGLCLLGGGRALTRRRQHPDDSHAATPAVAPPAELVCLAKRA
jgi:hypothetical protein